MESNEADKNLKLIPWQNRILLVRNLPYDATPTEIRNHLISKGKILRVDIQRDKAGQANGLAYVEFNSASDARAALSMDGQLFGGRKFRCQLSQNPPPELVRYYCRDPMDRPINDRVRARILEQARIYSENPAGWEDYKKKVEKEVKEKEEAGKKRAQYSDDGYDSYGYSDDEGH